MAVHVRQHHVTNRRTWCVLQEVSAATVNEHIDSADGVGSFRVAGASLVVLAAMMVFFLWLIAMGVTLLRWRPSVVPAAKLRDANRVAASRNEG